MQQALWIEGKKFLWDGRLYESAAGASQAKSAYEQDGFETAIGEDQGKHLVYTRRVARPEAGESQGAA